MFGFGIVAVVFLLLRLLGGSEGVPLGTPPVVIVTLLDRAAYSSEYLNNVKENREAYAQKHGKITN